MTRRFHTISLLSLVAAAAVVFTSCELQTEDPTLPLVRPARTLVINEVFTLPQTNQRAFSWIEFYNPTNDTVNTGGWTLTFTSTGTITKWAVDSNNVIIPTSFRILRQGEGEWEVPLPEIRLNAGEFITVTNNEERLLTYTDYGPGRGPKEAAGPNITVRERIVTPDSAVADTIIQTQIQFHLKTTDQLVLRNYRNNPAGEVVDVVRYGNFQHTGAGADPYPNNRSIGPIPEFQSIARYAGAYYTGNTATDFYITGVQIPQTRPIPHWLSQAYKQ